MPGLGKAQSLQGQGLIRRYRLDHQVPAAAPVRRPEGPGNAGRHERVAQTGRVMVGAHVVPMAFGEIMLEDGGLPKGLHPRQAAGSPVTGDGHLRPTGGVTAEIEDHPFSPSHGDVQ